MHTTDQVGITEGFMGDAAFSSIQNLIMASATPVAVEHAVVPPTQNLLGFLFITYDSWPADIATNSSRIMDFRLTR